MHNKFSNFYCFTHFFAHHGASLNNFNGNDQNRILSKFKHKLEHIRWRAIANPHALEEILW